jgi:cytochrome c oxidase assembly factor CtaG/polyferredoxin
VSAIARAVLSSWSLSPALAIALVILFLVYARGWRRLGWPIARLAAMAGGLGALVLAIASPIDALAGFLLSAHMVQHLLLLVVAPPLLLLAAPERVLLHGLPPSLLREAVAPFFGSRTLAHVGRFLTRPAVGVAAMIAATAGWHLPPSYQLALRSPSVHHLEHASFLVAALLFWWPLLHARRPRWSLIPCLLLADAQNTVLSAWLVFSDHAVYSSYASAPRLFGVTALDDQIIAGAIMWVPGSFAFLGAAILATVRWLSHPPSPTERTPRPRTPPRPFDLLQVPLVGPLLRARIGRRLAQCACFAIAALVVIDGLHGPRVAPMNLAGVVPWTYWRGLTVLALLVAGNFFCFACPFMLPRALGRRLGLARHNWPRALRGKWIAVALLAAFFVAQEWLGWWDAPTATALVILAYFAAAFAVDAWMRGASFCKYLCPIGQFHFVTSLVSPLEVKVRLPVVCASCETRDCVRACELDLHPPRKSGNFDCTFCLDCVTACPHDNLGLLTVAPGSVLIEGRSTRWQRLDVAVLALVIVLAGFALAGAMIRVAHPIALVAAGLAIAAALLSIGALHFRRTQFCRLSLALVPLGVGMWAAHLAFHLVTGWRSLLPIVERLLGVPDPAWSLSCAGGASDGLLTLELLLLDAGFVLSLYLGWRITRGLRRFFPFAGFAAALWTVGVAILFQPMQMRGMLP